MKKGLLYIDWSISIAIFIIYLVSLFIFISPVLSQEYSEDYLKTIARSGFEVQTFNTVAKYPIFIKHSTQLVNIVLLLDPPSNIRLQPENIGIFYDDATEIDSDIDLNPSQMKVLVNVTGDITPAAKLYMVISNETFFHIDMGSSPGITPDRYAFGVPEISRGLSINRFDKLKNDYTYEQIKEQLKYPKNKDLAIDIYNVTDPTQPLISSIQPSIKTQNKSVFVTQWSSQIIHKDATKELITILIQTW